MMVYRHNHASRGTPVSFTRREEFALEEPASLLTTDDRRTPSRRRQLLPSARPARDASYTAPVLLEVERWLKGRDMTATQFGRASIGDPNLVGDLRSGRDPSSRTVARIRAFMEREG